MPAKTKIYELARELDLTNLEVIGVCGELGIDAATHSSSIVAAQADRLRRKVEVGRGGQPPKPQSEEDTMLLGALLQADPERPLPWEYRPKPDLEEALQLGDWDLIEPLLSGEDD